MTSTQRSLSEEKFTQVRDFLKSRMGISKEPILKFLKWNSGLAGAFYPKKNEIIINEAYYLKNPQEMLDITIPHEVAHAYTHYEFRENQRKKILSHGAEWASVMKMLGLAPTPCHNYDTLSDSFSGVCRNCDKVITITPATFGKMKMNARISCAKCGAKLSADNFTFIPGVDTETPKVEKSEILHPSTSQVWDNPLFNGINIPGDDEEW